jgi:hypothetical protein
LLSYLEARPKLLGEVLQTGGVEPRLEGGREEGREGGVVAPGCSTSGTSSCRCLVGEEGAEEEGGRGGGRGDVAQLVLVQEPLSGLGGKEEEEERTRGK